MSFPGFYELLEGSPGAADRTDDRRHRRARRGREEHRCEAARGAARLPLPRHRCDVPGAHMARARARACRSAKGTSLGGLAREHPVDVRRGGRVQIDGTDVTAAIRQPRIDRVVPVVARHRRCATVMRERQRELAEEGDAVIEGRDIGTVVAPDAEVKVYLVADQRGARAPAQSPSGRRSAPTRSRPTCGCATRATPRACSRRRTRA